MVAVTMLCLIRVYGHAVSLPIFALPENLEVSAKMGLKDTDRTYALGQGGSIRYSQNRSNLLRLLDHFSREFYDIENGLWRIQRWHQCNTFSRQSFC